MATETPPDELRRRQREADDVIAILLLDWAEGRDTWEVVSTELEALLIDGHGDAYGLGRYHAGDTTADPDGDAQAGQTAWDSTASGKSQAEYWNGLKSDVAAGRYGVPGDKDNPARPKPLAQRVGLYTHNWTATANDAWAASLPPETLYTWTLGNEVKSEHCASCEEWAHGGPYTWDTLPAVPGDGTSECHSGCQCVILTEDGQEGFSI